MYAPIEALYRAPGMEALSRGNAHVHSVPTDARVCEYLGIAYQPKVSPRDALLMKLAKMAPGNFGVSISDRPNLEKRLDSLYN